MLPNVGSINLGLLAESLSRARGAKPFEERI